MSIHGRIDPKFIESLSPAVLRTIPGSPPPPGIQPNFADPASRVPVILGVSIAFGALAVACFSVRIYTKFAVVANWRWDDLTCSLGFMCSIVHFVVILLGCINGATGKHLWDMHLDKVLNKSTLNSYVTTIMTAPGLGLIKCSFFIQYYQLFYPLRWIRISIWIGAIISTIFYVTVAITAFILESPWPGETFLEGLLSQHYIKYAQFAIPLGVIGMLVDWYLFILPIPAVWNLKMSTSKKLGVISIFMTGGLAAIASILSMYYRVKLQENLSDPTWKVGYVVLWTQMEMFAGVTASSMPTVHQFFTRQNFSLASKWSALKSSLLHSRSNGTTTKLPSHHPSFMELSESDMQSPEGRKGISTKDLKYNASGRKAKTASSTQIHLTQDISITQEQQQDASLRPEDTYHRW